MEAQVLIENNNQVDVNNRNKETDKESAVGEESQRADKQDRCSDNLDNNPDNNPDNNQESAEKSEDNPDSSNKSSVDSKISADKSPEDKGKAEAKGMDETDYLNQLTRTIGQGSRNNSLTQKESSRLGGLFRSSRSSSSIQQHPLNSSQSNNEISTSATLTSNHSLKEHRHLLTEPVFSDINQNASPNSTTSRQSILNNFNDWLSNISTGSLFQNFLFTNPFRMRRGSRTPAAQSPNMSRSNSKNVIERPHVLKEDSQESNASSADFDNNASMLIGTLKPTLKGNELIELANLRVEIDTQEPGLGHRFEVSKCLSESLFKVYELIKLIRLSPTVLSAYFTHVLW